MAIQILAVRLHLCNTPAVILCSSPSNEAKQEDFMFDAKRLLDQFLGSQVPGAGGTVRDRADQIGQLAKDNPLATGALAAVLLGTGAGRQLGGSALRLGGLAAI